MARRVPEVEQEQRRGNAEWQILASQDEESFPKSGRRFCFWLSRSPRAGRNQRFTRVIGALVLFVRLFPAC